MSKTDVKKELLKQKYVKSEINVLSYKGNCTRYRVSQKSVYVFFKLEYLNHQ